MGKPHEDPRGTSGAAEAAHPPRPGRAKRGGCGHSLTRPCWVPQAPGRRGPPPGPGCCQCGRDTLGRGSEGKCPHKDRQPKGTEHWDEPETAAAAPGKQPESSSLQPPVLRACTEAEGLQTEGPPPPRESPVGSRGEQGEEAVVPAGPRAGGIWRGAHPLGPGCRPHRPRCTALGGGQGEGTGVNPQCGIRWGTGEWLGHGPGKQGGAAVARPSYRTEGWGSLPFSSFKTAFRCLPAPIISAEKFCVTSFCCTQRIRYQFSWMLLNFDFQEFYEDVPRCISFVLMPIKIHRLSLIYDFCLSSFLKIRSNIVQILLLRHRLGALCSGSGRHPGPISSGHHPSRTQLSICSPRRPRPAPGYFLLTQAPLHKSSFLLSRTCG
ncbi:translation initiation factor IF-2-like [Lutra lutra]|uniref:translation initiation factor IF-2-like n=1 Tax=Lutra lutra TaxID=9657 RepID=UPI001FD39ACB|nr:translation initiation factor IF-2-like [Lutra lutra]XP_047591497.1 translation initiation factor IF-2-like [Lutra lutra]